MQENNIPVAEFVKIEGKDELEKMIEKLELPLLLKTRRDAYDGRGNYKINSKDDVDDALDLFAGKTLMVEKFVNLEVTQ